MVCVKEIVWSGVWWGMAADELRWLKNAADLILSQRINLSNLYKKKERKKTLAEPTVGEASLF